MQHCYFFRLRFHQFAQYVKILPAYQVKVCNNPLHLHLESGFGLAPHTIGHPCCIIHQSANIIKYLAALIHIKSLIAVIESAYYENAHHIVTLLTYLGTIVALDQSRYCPHVRATR